MTAVRVLRCSRGSLRQCRAEGIGELAPDEADDNVLQFYEGGWHNGLKNGWGTARYRNGDVYEGTWRDNKMFGNGTYTWSDGTVFAGQFEVRKHVCLVHAHVHGGTPCSPHCECPDVCAPASEPRRLFRGGCRTTRCTETACAVGPTACG